MYTHFFGSYLLNKGIISQEQLLAAMEAQSSAHVKLGTLAVHAGYMTPSQAEQIFILQTHQDKRFGELAVSAGYLTEEQVDELLSQQVPDFISLGQILVDQKAITPLELDQQIANYRTEYEIDSLNNNKDHHEMLQYLLHNSEFSVGEAEQKYLNDYLILLFHNLLRFIGNDFTPLNILRVPDVQTDRCVVQDLECPRFHISSGISMDTETAITFASRYAKETFTNFDEYVRASMEDFINLHNGLFAVNMSNQHSLEVALEPPMKMDDTKIVAKGSSYLFPILYSFGMIYIICSI